MSLPIEIEARMDEIRAEIERTGAELIEVLFYRAKQRSVVTFLVDKAGGITLEDCVKLNQSLGELFDRLAESEGTESAVFQGRYLLEVSSPGLDRPLKTPKDFGRVLGQKIRVVCQNAAISHEPLVGKLNAVTELEIELETKNGARHAIPLKDISKATREISVNGKN